MPHTIRFFSLLFFVSLFGLLACSHTKRATQESKQNLIQSTSAQTVANHGQVPLSFEANHGQAKEPVKYLARGTNATLYLTPSEAALEVRHSAEKTALVKMKLLGAKEQPHLQGQGELPGKSNYFTGKDTKEWKTNIPTYQKVKYEEVYEGIDLVYYGNQQQLEYDFVVQPGANPKAIKFRFEGAEASALNEAGELVLHTAVGEVKQHKPVVYQEVYGKRQEIAGNYVLKNGEVGFAVGAYDSTQPLVIDPIIQWASFVGGQSSSNASAIAADKEGNVYLAVWDGVNPTTGAYDSGSGYSVMKVNPTGTAVLWTARIGSNSFDRAYGMALDKDNNVYLTGAAASSQYPTTPGAFQTDYGLTCSGCRKAFVTKLAAGGGQLIYSTFVSGAIGYQSNPGNSNGVAIVVDGQGQAYITGATSFVDFPTTLGAFQSQLKIPPRGQPPQDAFVTKLNATGTALLYSTYLGDPGNGDEGKAIAVDSQGNTFVAGRTGNGFDDGRPRIEPFPTTPGAYVTPDTATASSYLFLTKLNPSGGTLIYSTVIGAAGGSTDTLCLKVDTVGNAYLAGTIFSRTFPTTPGAYRTGVNSP